MRQRSYVDVLQVVIDHFQEFAAADPHEIRSLVTVADQAEARAAHLASELLAADAARQAALAEDPAYQTYAVVRQVLLGIDTMFRMRESADVLRSVTAVAVTLSHAAGCIPDVRSNAWRMQGDALRLSGRYPDAATAFRRAEAEAALAKNPDYSFALIRYSWARLHIVMGNVPRCAEALDGLATRFLRHQDEGRAASVLELGALILYHQQDYLGAAASYREALSAVRSDIIRSAQIMNNIGRCYMKAEDAERAVPLLRRAWELGAQAGDKETEAHARRSIAELTNDLGALETVRRLYEDMGYLGESISVELEIAKREVLDSAPVERVAARCSSIMRHACECGVEGDALRKILALEALAREHVLTVDVLTDLQHAMPSGPWCGNVMLN